MSATDPMTTATAEMFMRQRDEALRRVATMHEALCAESDRSEMAFRGWPVAQNCPAALEAPPSVGRS